MTSRAATAPRVGRGCRARPRTRLTARCPGGAAWDGRSAAATSPATRPVSPSTGTVRRPVAANRAASSLTGVSTATASTSVVMTSRTLRRDIDPPLPPPAFRESRPPTVGPGPECPLSGKKVPTGRRPAAARGAPAHPGLGLRGLGLRGLGRPGPERRAGAVPALAPGAGDVPGRRPRVGETSGLWVFVPPASRTRWVTALDARPPGPDLRRGCRTEARSSTVAHRGRSRRLSSLTGRAALGSPRSRIA